MDDCRTVEWITAFDRDMRLQKRKVLLVGDNCAAHLKDSSNHLHNVKLVFLPPNTTSLIQPCDMGIIRSIKHNYRKNMVSRIISEIDDAGSELSATTLAKAVTLLDAVHMLRSAWAAVTTSTVINCFGKAGFRKATDVDLLPDPTVDEPPPNMSHEEFNDYVTMDDGTECHGVPSDQEICDMVQGKPAADQEEEAAEPPPPEPVPTTSQAKGALHILRRFLEHNNPQFDYYYGLEGQVLEAAIKMKQKMMSDFLKQ